jgi:hypothetical protein
LITISLCFLPVRLYTRWLAFHRFFWDDLLTIIAWLLTLILGILATVFRHQIYLATYLARNQIPPSNIPPNVGDKVRSAIRGTLISFVLLYTSLWCIKFGFLIFFWRLGVRGFRGLRWHWWSVFVVSALAYVACFPALPYHCGFGTQAASEGRFCGDRDRILFEISTKVNCGLDVGTDALSEYHTLPTRQSVEREHLFRLS